MNTQLLVELEGSEPMAYDDSKGNRTVGVGFNMDSPGSVKIWNDVGVKADFEEVYNKKIELSNLDIVKLLRNRWEHCEKLAKARCRVLVVDWNQMSEMHKFIVTDIAYNTGSVNGWTKVFLETEPKQILKEARRKQHELDSRVAKIGHWYGEIDSVAEAIGIGLTETRYI